MSTLRVNNMTDVSGNGPTYAKGMVIQVVTSTSTGTVSTTSTAYTSANLSASITPKSTSSKIVVLISQFIQKEPGNSQNSVNLVIRRNSAVDLFSLPNMFYHNADIGQDRFTVSATITDFPNTTSSVSYGTFIASFVSGQSVNANWGTSSITLMEVAG